jgi:DNA-binding transcriptional MerR regulator
LSTQTISEDPVSKPTYSISDLSKEFDVTPRTIRFYEHEGLLAPRREGQTRIFSARDRARLAWILRGRRVGLSLADIGELLDLYDVGDGRVTQRQETLKLLRDRVKILEGQKHDIEETIEEIETFCGTLEQLLAGDDPCRKAG